MKTTCTASIFSGILCLLAAGWVFQRPDTLWWGPAYTNHPEQSVYLITWVFGNVIGPAGALFIVGSAATGLWFASAALCSWLRERFKP